MKVKKRQESAAAPEKALHTVAETCLITGKGRTEVYKALKDGRLKGLKDGDRTVITPEAIKAFVATLPPWKPRAAP
jgi:hypothetical protein